MPPRTFGRAAPPVSAADEWRAGALRNLGSARVLAAHGRDWVGVYYLAGFSVELMLKAVRIRRERLPGWPKTDTGYRWHDLGFVAQRCQILPAINAECVATATFAASWDVVRAWDPRRRYPPFVVAEVEARGILAATADPAIGMTSWLARLYARS